MRLCVGSHRAEISSKDKIMTDTTTTAPPERRHSAVAKVPRQVLTDQHMAILSPEARAVRLFAWVMARSDASQRIKGLADPGVGWLLGDTQAAITPSGLADVTGLPRATVTSAVKELVATGALVRSDARVLGVVGWWPETARYSTRKVQEWRARRAAA